MDELIAFPDVVNLAREEIAASITAHGIAGLLPSGYQFVGDVPDRRPKRFCRLRRIGGDKETRVSENALLVVECWASLNSQAVADLRIVRAVINSLDGRIFGVTEVGGPNDLPDPTTAQERMTMTFGVRVRGSILA